MTRTQVREQNGQVKNILVFLKVQSVFEFKEKLQNQNTNKVLIEQLIFYYCTEHWVNKKFLEIIRSFFLCVENVERCITSSKTTKYFLLITKWRAKGRVLLSWILKNRSSLIKHGLQTNHGRNPFTIFNIDFLMLYVYFVFFITVFGQLITHLTVWELLCSSILVVHFSLASKKVCDTTFVSYSFRFWIKFFL